MWIDYPNAGPIEVEQKIARKVEEALATVPRIQRIRTSSERNGCWTSVGFRQGTDMREAYNQLRDRADRLLLELPDEVDHIRLRNWDPDDWPILWMGIYLDGDYGDPQELLEKHLRTELQRIDGVGQVDLWGGPGKEVFIYTDQEKVRSHRVDLYRVGTQLASHNFTLPAGYVHEGGRKLLVRSLARFESVEEIRKHVVDPEHGLRLQDIAAVGLVPRPKTWFNRINGVESLGCEVLQAAEANTVEVAEAVRARLEELKARPRLGGFDYEIFWDMGRQITESVENLRNTGLWGGLFAAGVLFLFLRAVRMTLIITLAIPLALMISITAIYFLGWTLNLITMMGLMLSLGLVVDNAIVIVENIQRKREEGVEPREASITGAGEVGLAVTMATLTTVVVFLPLILMSDSIEFSFFMLRLGMPVIVGLLASLFIALAIIPLAALRISTGGKRRDSRLIARSRDAYVRCLRWVLGHRIESTILVLAALATIQIPMEGMKRTDRSSEHRSDLWLGFDMPEGQTLKQADKFIASVEDTLMNHKAKYNFRALETWSRNSRGRIHMILHEKENNAWYEVAWDNLLKSLGWRESPYLEYEEMVEDIKKRVVLPAGVRMRINWRRGGSGEAAVAINLYGEDTEVLLGLSGEVERRLRRIPGLLSVQTDIDRGSTELEVRL
ncbi:MAG: efflux RND transporter permease subunit, partial [Gemmatimonadetes bacterium]|nr:efflux RND transporter permease subunit [Gemmatimonadota bacterium]